MPFELIAANKCQLLYGYAIITYTWLDLLQITTFNISLVVHGTVAEDNDFQKVLLD